MAKPGYTLLTMMKLHSDIQVDEEDLKRFAFKLVWIEGKYLRLTDKGKTQLLHRLLMEAGIGEEIDHINGNTLDNRKVNLRIATRGQNAANCRKRCDNSSGYRGVFWNSKHAKWQVSVAGKYMGLYVDKEAAAMAYNRAALRMWGEYAKLNAIPSIDEVT